MTGTNSLRLQILLDAVDRATAPIKRIMAGSKGLADALRHSNQALKDLRAQQERLQGFRDLKNRVDSSGNAFHAAQQKVAMLRQEMAGVENPVRRSVAAMNQAERAAEKLKGAHIGNLRALQNSRDALTAAGIGARDFGNAERRLQTDIAATTARMKDQQDRLAALDAARQQAASIRNAGMKMTAVGGAMAFAGQRALRAELAPLQSAMQFESAMADVRKVVDFDTPEQFERMGRDIQDLSLLLPMASADIAQIVAAAGQANIPREELARFAEDAAKMGVAFDTTAEVAGKTMATWRTAFAMTQDDVVVLADKINYLGNTGPASVQDISEVVNRIGALGKVAGLGSGPLAALGATVVGMGKGSEVSATGIKNMLLTLSSGAAATKKQRTAMAALGFDETRMARAMQDDAGGAIVSLLEKLRRLPQEQQSAMMTQLFGRESVDAVTPLLERLELLKENFGKVADAQQYAGSMAAEYAARVATSENAMQLARNAANVLAQTIGKTLIPDFKAFAERTGAIVKRVVEWMRVNPELVKRIARLTVGITGLTTVLGGVLMAGGMAAMAFSQIHHAVAILSGGNGLGGLILRVASLGSQTLLMPFKVLLGLLGGISAPVLAIGAAVATVAFLVWKFWGPIQAFMIGLWDGIKMAVTPAMEEVMTALAPLAPVWETISGAIGTAWAWIKELFTPFQATNDQLRAATDNGRTFGLVIGTYLADGIRRTIRIVQTLIAAALAVQATMARVMVGIAEHVQGVWQVITGIFSGDLGRIRDGLQRMWTGINAVLKDWPARMLRAGVDMVAGLIAGIRSKLQAARDAIGAVGQAVIDRFTGPHGIDAHSPSRAFARFGEWTLQGLTEGLLHGRQRPIEAIAVLGDRLRQAGAGIALGAASLPAAAIHAPPPIMATTAPGAAAGNHYEIHIHAAPGMEPQAIADAVRRELDQRDCQRDARRRSMLEDY